MAVIPFLKGVVKMVKQLDNDPLYQQEVVLADAETCYPKHKFDTPQHILIPKNGKPFVLSVEAKVYLLAFLLPTENTWEAESWDSESPFSSKGR